MIAKIQTLLRRTLYRVRRLPRKITARTVDFGDLRRLRPVDDDWGFSRGQPIDRFYIEGFLDRHTADVQGHVLEVADDSYTRRFGGARVTRSDVISPVAAPGITIVDDLAIGTSMADATYDCVICTQTLLLVYDVHAAVATLHRVLKPGGVLLVTLPGISQIARRDSKPWGDHWRFTSDSARRLFGDAFGQGKVDVETHGNVLAAIAFLHGIASQELTARELAHHDRDYQVSITVRAIKAS